MDAGERLPGRLGPEAMFPAGVAGVRAREVSLPSGLHVRLLESGTRGDPPVLLLHGWGASAYMWRAWFAPLAAAGRHVLAIDLPGHGLSDKPDDDRVYEASALSRTVSEVIAAEALSAVDIVAQSMAGTVALHAAVASGARINQLVLVNPACFGIVRVQSWARHVSPRLIDAWLPRFVFRRIVSRAHQLVYHDPSRITARDIDEYWAPSQFPAYARAMRKLLHRFTWVRPSVVEMSAHLQRLRRPPLVILGAHDRLVRNALPYARALEGAGAPLRAHVVANGGHAVNEERPEDVVPLVLAFLDGR